MTSSRIERILGASLIACGLSLASGTATSADPGQPEPPPPAPAVSAPGEDDIAAPAAAACRQFAAALRVSSAYYNNFAYSIAGNGAHVDYQNPTVRGDNVDGRTAMRQAAGEALRAASTPGLQREIAEPMRSWSWRAAKLTLAMGLHGDGDALNAAATDLNNAAEEVQMACVRAGALPVGDRRR